MRESVLKQQRWSGGGGKASSASSAVAANRRRLVTCYLLCALGAICFILACGAHDHRAARTRFEMSQAQVDYVQARHHYFAANFHNNEAILQTQIPIYLQLFETLGERNCFISIFENGSKDGTQTLLRSFATELRTRGIGFHIVMSAAASWNADGAIKNATMAQRIEFMARARNAAMLPLLQVSSGAQQPATAAAGGAHQATISSQTAAAATAATAAAADDVAIQEWVRAQASEVLSSVTSVASDDAAAVKLAAVMKAQESPLHAWTSGADATRPVSVLFANDVYFTVADALRLLLTRDGDYDMACGMDFDLVKLYDVWVTRDLNGNHLSGFYPFVHEAAAQRSFQRDLPFQVYTCWNGLVAMQAKPFLHDSLRFRKWTHGELRSANPRAHSADAAAVATTAPVAAATAAAATSTSSHAASSVTGAVASANAFRDGTECEASECLLIGKDLWMHGHHRVYMNPLVRVYYNAETVFLQQWVVPFFNNLFWGWYNAAPAGANADAKRVPAVAADAKAAPCASTRLGSQCWEVSRTDAPLDVACGVRLRGDIGMWSLVWPIAALLLVNWMPTFMLYRVSKVFFPSAPGAAARGASASVTSLLPLPSGVAERSHGGMCRCCFKQKSHDV